ncbi:hypothetical protein [Enterococcus sp. DIV0170]|uniref:hypothetical protein n=1 Tax=Enterococcus sp. DIV0170 TaxID=2774642 RepID=UPI003F291900
MTTKEKTKVVLFQGTGYRIMEKDNYNVVLEVQNEDQKYVFAGFYCSITKALRGLVSRDLLIDRQIKHDVASYLKEVTRYKQQIMNDIDAHFMSAEVDELFK